jgi:hypothetical protein
MRSGFRSLGLLTSLATLVAPASAGTLYTCVDARGIVRYAAAPCVDGQPPMAIDRVDAPAVTPQAQAPSPAPERALTPAETERIAHLREAEPGMTREARIASEIEIAAIREGASASIAADDARALEALRPQLAADDPQVRERALRAWQAIYARYRVAARPRHHLPDVLAAPIAPRSEMPPSPPLGQPVPGMQGPLVAAPPITPPLAGRGAPVADPATGRVLAPFGDRLVDPITGTLYQRAGPMYVDPATGRVIPAP